MILSTLKCSLFFTIYTIGIFIIFGVIYRFIEKKNSFYIQSVFGFNGILFTGIIGTPLHELGHYIMCLIFNHKVTRVELFRPSACKIDGVLGFVSHSYNKNSLYQQIGNFFIGIAPLIFGSLTLILSFKILLPDMFLTLNIYKSINLINQNNVEVFFTYLYKTLLLLSNELFNFSNLLNFKFWIFLFLSSSITTHMSLSKKDLQNSISGIVSIFLVSFGLCIVSDLLNINLLSFQSFLLKYNLYLASILILGLLFALITLLISYTFYFIKRKNI
ncbi:hypothetical protein CHF27_004360 [Romboutsia maritimum]|uniref:Uncharacterized protein n=1 Tax=Romboutsia maritimum TaxID=2020948 RepID=A0A371IV07_9FIRM|nr:hypothetical protein [Romboutsia maritimum]RDY24322.1 hypothetical protein CHF27_004360 [Romboutsia maritimum]